MRQVDEAGATWAGFGVVLRSLLRNPRHARIFKGPEGWMVEDLGSTNGTFIGPQRLTTPTPVTAGTEIRFFSPPLRGLLIGPAESRIWGAPHAVPRQSAPDWIKASPLSTGRS